MKGLSLVDAAALAMFRSVFAAARLPGLLTAMTLQKLITAALAEAGVAEYTRASIKITAIAAVGMEALHLRLPLGGGTG